MVRIQHGRLGTRGQTPRGAQFWPGTYETRRPILPRRQHSRMASLNPNIRVGPAPNQRVRLHEASRHEGSSTRLDPSQLCRIRSVLYLAGDAYSRYLLAINEVRYGR